MTDIPVDRAGRPMFDADGKKLTIAEREAARNQCQNCGFEWGTGHGEHDCLQVKDAAYHWVCIERDKLREELTALKHDHDRLQDRCTELVNEKEALREDNRQLRLKIQSLEYQRDCSTGES